MKLIEKTKPCTILKIKVLIGNDNEDDIEIRDSNYHYKAEHTNCFVLNNTESGNNSTGIVFPAQKLRCASGQNELRGPKIGGPNKGKNSSVVGHLWGLVGQMASTYVKICLVEEARPCLLVR